MQAMLGNSLYAILISTSKNALSFLLLLMSSLQQDAPPLTNGLRKCGIYTQWNFMQP
jgi:hypothetical protein